MNKLFYKFIIVYYGAISQQFIKGFVIASDENSAREKISIKYLNKYNHAEIRQLKETDIIDF